MSSSYFRNKLIWCNGGMTQRAEAGIRINTCDIFEISCPSHEEKYHHFEAIFLLLHDCIVQMFKSSITSNQGLSTSLKILYMHPVR